MNKHNELKLLGPPKTYFQTQIDVKSHEFSIEYSAEI